MQKTQLVIMAAGLGSRFGGLKQMAPVDPQGHWIIDYSIFDALRAGFSQIVLIIKPENEALFRETLGARIGGKADIVYVHQKPDVLPEGMKPLKIRAVDSNAYQTARYENSSLPSGGVQFMTFAWHDSAKGPCELQLAVSTWKRLINEIPVALKQLGLD